MQREIPEVETITRIRPSWGTATVMAYGDKKISELGVWRVDSSFFDVFSIPFKQGDPKSCLSDINSIVLTESTAKRYFQNEDPIGKVLKMNRRDDVTVTAVIADVPAQAHFHYDFLLSFRRLPMEQQTNWGNYNDYTYVKVRPGTDMALFETKIQGVYERNQEERYSDFYTQPLLDIHLKSKLKWELESNGDQLYVYVFLTIGIFILLIAAINYINLSTANTSLRAKETGIRKVSGAERTSLVFQFLLESVILCVVASVVALSIAYALTPMVNDFTQKQLHIGDNPVVMVYLVLVTVFIGVIAGIFPALYLSSFKPATVLKGLKVNDKGSLNLRKSLVLVQFTISAALIISALIIIQQMNYVQSAKLGFDKDQIVVIKNGGGLSRADKQAFLNSIRQLSGVTKASTSGTILGQGFATTRLAIKGSKQEHQLNFASVGFNFLDVVGIEMKEGRSFSEDFASDSLRDGIAGGPLEQRLGGIVINEQAAKEFALDSPAIGKQFVWAVDGDTTYYVDVVGIAKNFHFTSLRNEIKPFGFIMMPRIQWNFTVKLSSERIPQVLTQLEDLWKTSFPEVSFEYIFMDETFSKMYNAEVRFQKAFISLVILGIIIACLGLFALATFSAEQRVKEIGVRKVLGASVGEIVALLSKDFLKLVVISLVLAVPLSYYVMQAWLEGFAYRIAIQWWVFFAAGAIALLTALITVSSQAIKAALANPAKSLRSE
jgi:putative ABC transport system permease protein